MNKCPFKAGDIVVYKPSQHGYGWGQVHTLEMGKVHKISEIPKEVSVLVEGDIHLGGGIYWSEFQRANKYRLLK